MWEAVSVTLTDVPSARLRQVVANDGISKPPAAIHYLLGAVTTSWEVTAHGTGARIVGRVRVTGTLSFLWRWLAGRSISCQLHEHSRLLIEQARRSLPETIPMSRVNPFQSETAQPSVIPRRTLRGRLFQIGRIVVLLAGILTIGGAASLIALRFSGEAAPAADPQVSTIEQPIEKIRRQGKDHVIVPESIGRKLGLKVAIACKPTRPIRLAPFPGTLALDNNALARVHARFAGEVAEIGVTRESLGEPGSSVTTSIQTRPLRFGDSVTKGQVLAVIWSKELGEKKSELVDAVSKLRSDLRTLDHLEALYKEAGTSERSVREQERNVQSDRVAVERAERTLRSWRLTDQEINAVRAEADRLNDPKAARNDAATWARVEVRSPMNGMILEKNIGPGDIVDTTNDLFKIGDLTHLAVWAHVFEENLPLLQGMRKPAAWRVNVPSQPDMSFPGNLEQIGAVIDPNQHTALVCGRVENPRLELKVGQQVTVSVAYPAPDSEVELPAEAVIEDGRASVVFVQTGSDRADVNEYVRRSVVVSRRFRDVIYVKLEQNHVAPGDRVVTSGVLLLHDAFEQLPTSEK